METTMDLCEGTPRRPHPRIVQDEGWAFCPLCAAIVEIEHLQDSLKEAEDDVASWRGLCSEAESELAQVKRDRADA
jgi:hypothetical protein